LIWFVVHAIILGMYLRTTKRKNQDGTEVVYYQLAHNVRHPSTGHTVAQVIHNFGRADQLPREDLVRLCRSIARVCGLEVSDPLQGSSAEVAAEAELSCALPAGVELVGSRRLGLLWVVEALWERLAIGPTVRQLLPRAGGTARWERALLAMVANRLCGPQSKLGVWERWRETVYFPSGEALSRDQLYEAMDWLQAHALELEEAVFFRTADLFKLEVDLIFYDTTTCSFAIDTADEDETGGGLRRWGRAKEGGWGPQVVVALAVTREGLPVRSWVFPGNTTDVTTVAQIKDDLRGWQLGRVLFVGDAGMHSEANCRELARGGGRYVLAMPIGTVAEVKQAVLSRPGRYRRLADNLQAKEVVVGDGERRRRYLVCFNPREAERQAHHRAQVVAELKAELARHATADATAKWAMELLTSKRYRRYLTVTDSGQISLDTQAIRQAQRLEGKWVLLTNDDTLSLEDGACAYKSLMVIERCFRSLKRGQIYLGPMYHRLPQRIEAHVKICVLALLIQRVVEHTTGQSWFQLRHHLNALQVTEFRTATHQFCHRTAPSAEVQKLFKKLAISMPKQVLAVPRPDSNL
jgi:transposase